MAAKRSSRRRSSRRSRKQYSKVVVRRGSLRKEEYLQKDGTWGPYKAAKRFDTQTAAEKFYRLFHSGEDFGTFPTSSGPTRR